MAIKPNLNLLVDLEHATWQDALTAPQAHLETALHAALDELSAQGKLPAMLAGRTVEVSALLTDDAQVQTLNRDYRGKDKPTNVLSFPQLDDMMDGLPDDAEIPLGDLVLAYETVASEAKARDIEIGQHVSHLMVHGLLHLLGFDHEDDHSAEAMEQLEITVMKRLGLADPYALDRTLLDNHAANPADDQRVSS